MAFIDILLILIAIVGAWIGFRKGIITQLGSLAAIVIAIIVCRLAGSMVVDLILSSHQSWQADALKRFSVSVVTNCIIYVVVYYGIILLSRFIKTATHALLLGPIDRIAGAVFTMAKYFLLVSLLLNLYIALVPSTKLLSKSRIAGGQAIELVIGFAPWLLDTLSPVETDTRPMPENVEIQNISYPDTEINPM